MVRLNEKFSLMSVGCFINKNAEHNASEKMINFLRAREKKLQIRIKFKDLYFSVVYI
jgi:hypothetical protein